MKLTILTILCWIISCGLLNNPSTQNRLVFEDNFDFFDKDKWTAEIGFRHEAFNTPHAIKVENGNLVIHPYTKNKQHFSGVLNTKDKFEFNKGYVEIRAKFSDLPGTWSCFWLYADSVGLNEDDLNKNGAEIDIFEHRAFDCNKKDIGGYLNHTIHWNGYDKYHKVLAADTGDLKINDNKFHIISLMWTENYLEFFVDGISTWKLDFPNFRARLFLVVSTEIGFLDYWTVPPPDIINDPTLTVDYIRVYQ